MFLHLPRVYTIKNPAQSTGLHFIDVINYLIASFNALPDTNAGTLDAAIWISAPVCGLRPVRAARSFTLNVPKPINCTGSPFLGLQ